MFLYLVFDNFISVEERSSGDLPPIGCRFLISSQAKSDHCNTTPLTENGLLSSNMSSEDLKVDQVLIWILPSGVMEFLAVG